MSCTWAYLEVRGTIRSGLKHSREELFKSVIGPSQPKQQEMVEAVLTPANTNPLESLLNQPFTSTFNHFRAQRQAQLLKVLITGMALMALKVILHCIKVERADFDQQKPAKCLGIIHALSGPLRPSPCAAPGNKSTRDLRSAGKALPQHEPQES